jgi:hypothetical protein
MQTDTLFVCMQRVYAMHVRKNSGMRCMEQYTWKQPVMAFWNNNLPCAHVSRTRSHAGTQVDSWDDEHMEHFIDEYFAVVQAFRAYGQRSTVLRLTFEHAISFFQDGHFDLVYVDGYAHTGHEGGETIEAWYQKVAPGGMLAGHDYDLAKWPWTYHNVNLLANRHNLTVLVTEACEDAYASWAIMVPDEEELEAIAAAAQHRERTTRAVE